MQATQPETIKASIAEATTKYLVKLGQSDTVDLITEHSNKLIDRITDLLHIKLCKKKHEREPQSEREEAKSVDKFETAVNKEVRLFIENLKNYKIVAEADLEGLNKRMNSMLENISLLDKFKGEFEVDIQAVADKLN